MNHNFYDIEGTKNINIKDCYSSAKYYPSFRDDYKQIKKLIKNMVKTGESKTFLQFCDGEYCFLKKIPYGTATPGYVTLKDKGYEDIDLKPFFDGVLKNDYIAIEIHPPYRDMFHELFPDREIDFPSEYLSALLFNRWFTKTFDGQIGLIGAAPKMKIIQKLQKYPEYLEYLGMRKGFVDFIEFPQRGGADDIKATEKLVLDQLEKSKVKIFLFGIGQSKLALAHAFKKAHPALYVDVGAGIDGLAGMVDIHRPYAGMWTNFRIDDYDYSDVHQTWSAYKGEGKHVVLKSKRKKKSSNRSKELFNDVNKRLENLNVDYFDKYFVGFSDRYKQIYASFLSEDSANYSPYLMWLYALVRETKPKQVIELGAHWGMSTHMMLSALGEESKLYSVDIKPDWRLVQDDPRLVKVIGRSEEPSIFPPDVDLSSTDLWFIDTEHTYEQIQKEFSVYEKFWKKGAVVVLDDVLYFDERPQHTVYKFWDELDREKVTSDTLHVSGFGMFVV